MPVLLITLIKINFALALFAIAYYTVLRRLTFYSLNRVFLLAGILFSTAYPLFTLFLQQHTALAKVVPVIRRVQLVVDNNREYDGLILLFCTVAALLFVRLGLGLFSLWQIHKGSVSGMIDGQGVRLLQNEVAPFSFGRHIYVNPHLHEPQELHSILEHEKVHVKQWHTLDILIAELSVVFYWFNPGMWLIRKSIRENLEFITDEKVLRCGINRKAYQYSLLEVSNLKFATPLTNHFNLSGLKRRIRMMNAKRSSKLTLGRYALVLPVVLPLMIVFAASWTIVEHKTLLAPVKKIVSPAKAADTVSTAPVTPAKPARAKRRKPRPTVAPADNQEIVVVGYPSPGRKTNNDTATQPSEEEPVRVVVGYPTPRNKKE